MHEKDLSEEFSRICKIIYDEFERQWNEDSVLLTKANEQLKLALQGVQEGELYFKRLINDFLEENEMSKGKFPPYYKGLTDAIYHENWGLAGIAEWFTAEYKDSSSLKVIGENIYCLHGGEMRLMPQKIDNSRRSQLVSKLLTIKPDERKNKDNHEIYLQDGTRVTIFNEAMTKPGQDSIIFRRYTIPEYTFEEQAKRNTIPPEAIPLFKNMIALGYNVAITGAVRTAKTTFLATWQRYEDPTLEGILIETDPEIPIHKIMPQSPIIQIVADGDKLRETVKKVMRSDGDYLIMAEARDGIALDTAVRIANKGTRRCKMTFHNRDPIDFVYDVASEITRTEGGELGYIAEKVAQSVDYIFYFVQLKDKSQKRLDSIYELSFDKQTRKILLNEICRYNKEYSSWRWSNHITEEKRIAAIKENSAQLFEFENNLKDLAKSNEIIEPTKFEVSYL